MVEQQTPQQPPLQESEEMKAYFEEIQKKVDACFLQATKAREQGYDPEKKVAIKLAKNMAERVEGLIGVVAPQLIGSGVTVRIIELEKEFSPLDWRVALKIAHEVALEKFCTFKDKKEAIEIGIRTGFAYQTGGIVSAPLEGFIELKIKKTREGKEYFAPCYAGPIRGAGGTAAAFSLIITDYVRIQLGYATYDPSEKELGRYKTEICDYHERVTNLQYLPSEEEIDFLMRHLPVEIDGDPTEERDVSNYKDLDRIETNRIRGGMCLVLAEGLSQKAPKLWKRLQTWGAEFNLDWGFLKEFLALQKDIKAKKAKAKEATEEKKEKAKISPNYTFVADIVAGRPVLTQPMASGGFRLRYGRTRMTGFSAAAIHPATMVLLDDFIAVGTQLKVERPGKAAAITSCEFINGPVVLLETGEVVYVDTTTLAKKIRKQVKEILYLGDILFNYGDFSENGHVLVPAGYCEEWWIQELQRRAKELDGECNPLKIAERTGLSEEIICSLLKTKGIMKIEFSAAKRLSECYSIPLHPAYHYYWNEISNDHLKNLVLWLEQGKILKAEDGIIEKIVLSYQPLLEIASSGKRALELLGVEHLMVNNEFVVIEKKHAEAFLSCLGIERYEQLSSLLENISLEKTVPEIIAVISKYPLRNKSGTFIGARMGRPEKAKMRKLTGSPHVLFPVGEEGGKLRSFQTALEKQKVTAEFPLFWCHQCNYETVYKICDQCHAEASQQFFCKGCVQVITSHNCPQHGEALTYTRRAVSLPKVYQSAMKTITSGQQPELVKGVRGTANKDHIVEQLVKGILRARHGVYVNKDGTIRFDMSEVPITHFKPREVNVSVEKIKELGYTHDFQGNPLSDADQILELKPQDIIIPAGENILDTQAEKVLFNVAKFVDDLLISLYHLEPFYNLKKSQDLVGHLVLALAPHISAGMVGRIIGFSQTQGFLAHPMFHASLRRDCDGDEGSISLLMDAFLNFSGQYLPNTRGAKTMDAPLVLTSKLVPSEVDDQAHGLDVADHYPLELYEAALNYKNPWEVPVEQINKRLGTPLQYEQMKYTMELGDINQGVMCSSYKSLPSMEEKLNGQMGIAVKLRAVDQTFVAGLIINKHFLKDTKGNLRKFSQQIFRCVVCNEKFRRPPLLGKCTACGGKLIFTISEGSIIKYLGLSIKLAQQYNVSPYLSQILVLLNKRVESVFGKEKEKQEGLSKWA